VRKITFLALALLACTGARFHPDLIRGFYPNPQIQVDRAAHEAEAMRAAKDYLYPAWNEIQDSLGFNISSHIEYRGVGYDGDTLIYRFFSSAIGDPIRKLHPIFAGAFLQVVIVADTPRIIYFKELPWE